MAPGGLVLLGWVGLIDPVRPEVSAAIARCAEAGIDVRMVTGDHPGTALTIARGLGLEVAADQVVTGAQMTELAEQPERLAALILGGRVFARIEPVQKLEIVRILAASGELVAVTGDGVNDAPALQSAHIGVAMGIAGTNVARGAADLVLADDNFASIVAGIEEGRVTYANVRRIVIILLATGIAEIGMFIGAVMLGVPMPLTAVQLLWLNLVTNGAQDVMLGFDRGEGDELRQPPRPPSAPILDRSAIALMILPALLMTLLARHLVAGMQGEGRPLAEIQNAVLLMTVLFQNAYVLCMRSERRSIFREPVWSNAWLLLGVGIALALQATAMLWPPLGSVLGTAPVSAETMRFCIAAVVGTMLVTEATKQAVALWQHRRWTVFVPKIVTTMPEGYSLATLRADAIAGATVVVVALPLAMALGIASGAPPAKGLVTAIVAVFTVIARHGYDGMILATLLAGVLLIAVGYAHLGGLIRFIPYTVVIGFMAGIAVSIASRQVRDFLGLQWLRFQPASFRNGWPMRRRSEPSTPRPSPSAWPLSPSS